MEGQTLRFVPHLDSSKALVFPVVEITLHESVVFKIGRSINDTSRQQQSLTNITFRSKVVSRKHAEIFLELGKIYLRDIQSSSGTFLNGRRLCPPNSISQPFELHDNDIIQLGVDYQGGTQEIFRCVKMKLELNKANQNQDMNLFNLKSFHSLRTLTTPPANNTNSFDALIKKHQHQEEEEIHVEECCICLFAIAPFQALFVAPCSHTFHFKCLRPLLINYPGFSCPLCRSYADLDANVSIEVDEVKAMLLTMKSKNNDSTA